jgi:undecaprenyl-diphosphatase
VKDFLRKVLNLDARASKALLVPTEKKFLSLIFKIFAHSGDSWFWLAGLLLVWLLSEREWKQRAFFLGTGLIIMAAAVILLKFTIRRPRPDGDWGKIYRITDPHSFPSGHAARSTALAVMALGCGPTWFAILLVIWAPTVGLSRIALGIHYLSDVIAGWVVGAAMGGIALAARPLIMRWFELLF